MKPGRGGSAVLPRGQWIYTLHAFGVTISLVEAGERMEHCTQTKKEKTDQPKEPQCERHRGHTNVRN